MAHEWADLLMEDHQVTENVFETVREALEGDEPPPRGMIRDMLEYVTVYLDSCHHKKEEEHLFPLIKDRGVPEQGGPLAVMEQEHEQSRALMARLENLAKTYIDGNTDVLGDLTRVFKDYTELLKSHFWKENDILYPLARQVMTEGDEQKVMQGISAVEDKLGDDTRRKYYHLAQMIGEEGPDDLSIGLDRGLMASILNTLPLELSFVDHDDKVRYFSHEQHKKIFPRSRGIIGLDVRNCHPEKSVHMVEQILADFKAGKRDVAEFWIDFDGRKIHIRYFPVRSPAGQYLGCLETIQDVTAIQQLEGQKRLLDEE